MTVAVDRLALEDSALGLERPAAILIEPVARSQLTDRDGARDDFAAGNHTAANRLAYRVREELSR